MKFDLDIPEDERRFNQCVKAEAMALALWEIQANLRRNAERESDLRPLSDPIGIVFEKLFDIMEEQGVDPSRLVI